MWDFDVKLIIDKIIAITSEDPVAAPIYWVTSWVDYFDRYGFGYKLCDNTIGVIFDDFSQLLAIGGK